MTNSRKLKAEIVSRRKNRMLERGKKKLCTCHFLGLSSPLFETSTMIRRRLVPMFKLSSTSGQRRKWDVFDALIYQNGGKIWNKSFTANNSMLQYHSTTRLIQHCKTVMNSTSFELLHIWKKCHLYFSFWLIDESECIYCI